MSTYHAAAAEESRSVPPTFRVPSPPDELKPTYTNFCRVAGTADEMIVDFGFNTGERIEGADPVSFSDRLVMTYVTAKRLIQVLSTAVARHEKVFGVVETDSGKRANQVKV